MILCKGYGSVQVFCLRLMFMVLLCSHAKAASLVIDVDQSGPEINKNIYGQFAEHLGRQFYDGFWVGQNSEIPNTKGWRNDVLEALRDINVPVIRWPGGCFADDYHWRDGIGPEQQRPATVNTLWGGITESNAVGTHEFFDLAELLGADAYINGNLGTGSARDMSDWMEYMTSDSDSGLAALRRQNGRSEPFRVHHFGIGNESWGCGGHMTPEYYTHLFKHRSTMLRPPWDVPTHIVASGGHGYGDAVESSGPVEWTEYLSTHIQPNFLLGFDAISFHYYTHPKGSVFEAKGSATGFPETEWMSTLAAALKMDDYLAANVAVLDKTDPGGSLALYVDEWGAWYDPAPGTNPAQLYQQNTIRDAIVAALNFNIFHSHAARVKMANIAQMVNVLQAMVLTDADRMVLTPTYYAFQMYQAFQGAISVPFSLEGAADYRLEDQVLPALHATVARTDSGQLVLALVNIDPGQGQSVHVRLSKGTVASGRGRLLSGDSLDAHNSFTDPARVIPREIDVQAENGQLTLTLPAKSILVVDIQ